MVNNDEIARLNIALELIEKRKNLQQRVRELAEQVNYLNTQPMPYSIYKPYIKQTVPATRILTIISNVMACLALFMIFVIIYKSSNDYFYTYRESSNNDAILFWLFLIVGAVLGTVSTCIKKSHYHSYLAQDEQNRAFFRTKVIEYEPLKTQLEQLEHYMADPKNCAIPKKYWEHGLEISGYIRNGRAETVEDAIELLERTSNFATNNYGNNFS